MGHIVFAAPTIDRFHLHNVLGQQLLRRGHRVTVLASDPITQRFYAAQGMRTRLLALRRATSELRGMPLGPTALRDCQLAGVTRPTTSQLQRARVRLGRTVPGLLRFFGVEAPDMLMLHRQRSGLHAMIDFIAREYGCEVLHTGDGLLPGTMQWDTQGIDGDASACKRKAVDYHRQPRDASFVMAALAAVLGGSNVAPIARDPLAIPSLGSRTRGIVRAIARRQLGPAWHGLAAWRRALRPAQPLASVVGSTLPDGPFVTVLLQDPRSPAVRLDAVDAPNHSRLIIAAHAAAWNLDSSLPLVVVPPPGGVDARALRTVRERTQNVTVCAPGDEMNALTTALAVVTINHPHGLAAILSGTPLLHTGTALYSHAEVSTPTTVDRMRDDLRRAVDEPGSPYRESYLTRTLVYDHVWCDPDQPDENGLLGLIQNIEQGTQRVQPVTESISYRAGPAWMASEE